jgi:hypothetical protein
MGHTQKADARLSIAGGWLPVLALLLHSSIAQHM